MRITSASPGPLIALRSRRTCTSTVRGSTWMSRPQTASSNCSRGEDPAGMLHQEFQQPVLGRAEMQRAAVAGDAVRVLVHRQVVEGQHAAAGDAAGPPQQRADAGQQPVHGEGLGDVVVGAGVEGADAVLLLGPGGHHDDRQVAGRRPAAELAADLEARKLRQHPVQQHQVGLGLGDAEQRLLPVRGLLDPEALLLQVVAQQGQQRRPRPRPPGWSGGHPRRMLRQAHVGHAQLPLIQPAAGRRHRPRCCPSAVPRSSPRPARHNAPSRRCWWRGRRCVPGSSPRTADGWPR